MIRKLTALCIALAVAGVATAVVTLFRPPLHDGVWLLSLLFILASLACGATVIGLAEKENHQ